VSSLADISIFTIEEDVPLKDVFEKMKAHYNSGVALDHKAESKALRAEMEKFLPTYDAERVYDSDIKKLFQWYNILQSKEMLDFEAETEAIKWKKKYEEEHIKFIEADSLRLIYSTYIVDDKKLHEGCLKAGSYGNYKQTTN
jgi:hypothetical protein